MLRLHLAARAVQSQALPGQQPLHLLLSKHGASSAPLRPERGWGKAPQEGGKWEGVY